ncbi:coiled-coil domain-containing protein 113 [Neoarius graeffei]|uniref:coiled-coil domain-containing protein 113 n=1 Tax=Neoarius graeffei TaxID=443677 RepID=UPI00298C4520|nr:coiled-coil domain-containing protein 113 [Neoarius graeffei]
MAESTETESKEATLKQQVEELRYSNEVLQTENKMFESCLSRLDSLSLASELVPQMEKGAGHGGKSEGRETSQEPPTLLKLEQKYYIAVCELKETQKDLEQLSSSLSRNHKYYEAAIKDSDIRLIEIKRERHDFDEFVAKTHQNTPVLAQRAQKVIRYIEWKIKAKNALTERTRRRIAFLRMQSRKRQRMVHQKEQMQETLCKIDLEYLKQKNIQSQELLQNIQKQLRCDRMLVRKSQRDLNVHKERLKKETEESKSLSRNLASHEEKLSKIREQQQKVETKRAQAEALNQKLKAQMADFRVPDVMRYVEAKATNDQLRKTVKSLERQARVAKMMSKTKKNNPGDPSGCIKSTDY